jgi:hypothetical protein
VIGKASPVEDLGDAASFGRIDQIDPASSGEP